MAGKVKCPRCSTIVDRPAAGSPVCPQCGFGAKPGAAPQAASIPAHGTAPAGSGTPMPAVLDERTRVKLSKPVTTQRLVVGALLLAAGLAASIGSVLTEEIFWAAGGGLLAIVGMVLLAHGAGLVSPRHAKTMQAGTYVFVAAWIIGRYTGDVGDMQDYYVAVGIGVFHDLLVGVAVILAVWNMGGIASRTFAVAGTALGIATGIVLLTIESNPFGIGVDDFVTVVQSMAIAEIVALALAAAVAGAVVATKYGDRSMTRWQALQTTGFGRKQAQRIVARAQRRAGKGA